MRLVVTFVYHNDSLLQLHGVSEEATLQADLRPWPVWPLSSILGTWELGTKNIMTFSFQSEEAIMANL
jgi:hypothetical protein